MNRRTSELETVSPARWLRAIPSGAALIGILLAGAFTGAASAASTFTLTSPDLKSGTFANTHVLNGFGCTGGNVSPALEWSNLPAGTRSIAIQVLDQDEPTGSGFWHWTVYNIPASAKGLPQGAGNTPAKLPAPAFNGVNDFTDTGVTGGNGNYGGPCPPVGDKPHTYIFSAYALAVEDVEAASGIPRTGSAALHGYILNRGLGEKVLGKASFVARYGH
ncbi:YbhB/YbcL family Raf kinase inhibitor-like protein [Pseudomonas sp. MWU16-30323]|jgi:hypothetical protein|uniref:YbhB/YbcL family Raf kinase inhibitor-like protein n=1 Tax=Pseudomonas sp. MWU16-30323 TaxID=2878094 RepID=UPI001CFBE069|nr:YbhB/YbcL family Raf kinase inhibitor-like protein [Pseudomonas sp. MWU16-30323]